MKSYITILTTSLIFVFSACTDSFLDIQNKNSVDVNTFFETETDLLTAVNAAYTPLAQNGMFGLEYFRRQNALDPFIWFKEPNTGWDVMNFSPVDFNRTNYISTWSDLYIGLFRTSDILLRMQKLKTVVADTKFKEYEAQLKALRAMYYFYLVTWFDKAIYYDENSIPQDYNTGLKNGTPEQFWSKIEEDLDYAKQYLPVNWDAANTGRITSGAAYALLGKALLYKHYHYYLRFEKSNTEIQANLAKAKTAFFSIMDKKNGFAYELIKPVSETQDNYKAALLSNFSYVDIPVGTTTYKAENNKESVWEVQFNSKMQQTTAWSPGSSWGGNLLYAYYSPRGYKDQVIDPTLWDEFESAGAPVGFAKDPRAYATCYLDGDLLDWRENSGYKIPFNSTSHASLAVSQNNLYPGISPSLAIGLKKYYYPQFFEEGETTLSAPCNVRVIRYADVLLMFAEVNFLINEDADGLGLKALNEVRKRAGMPEIAILTPEAIIHERNVELATEGHHYNDIIRWSFDQTVFKVDLNALFKGRFNVNKHHYFPIPQEEIDNNKGQLLQNAGW